MEEVEKEVLDDFKNRLIELNKEIEKIEKNSQEKGDKFNIFSILGIQRKEIGTHSFLLYELINPEGSHYQGNLYLDIFIKEVLGIYDFEFKNFEVNRETFISGKGIKNGFIDFTIENNDYFIAIEMKIGSLETGEQLDNYRKFIDTIPNKNKGKRLYYLTLFGDEADKSKIKEDIKNGYIRISFLEHISSFIEKSIEKSKNRTAIKEILLQYQKTIKNITNQTTGEFSEMIEDLIKEPKMVKVATILSKELPELWAKKELDFWDKLEKKLKDYSKSNNLDKNGWKISFYDEEKHDKLSYIKKSKTNNIYITKNDFYLRAFTQTNGNFFYNIQSYNKKIDIDRINKELKFEEETEIVKWQFTKIKNGLSFSKDYENPTYDVFDEEKLNEIVEKIYKEIIGYMDRIIKLV